MDKILWAIRNVLVEIENYGEAGDHGGKLDAIFEEVRALEARARQMRDQDAREARDPEYPGDFYDSAQGEPD